MASAYLSRTPSTAGNRKTWTWSGWVKKCYISSNNKRLFAAGTSLGTNSNNAHNILFNSSDDILITGEVNQVLVFNLQTDRKFRDTNSWYHIVVAYDSTETTSSDRIKVWVNGVQETSFSSSTYPSLNQDTFFNATNVHYVGSDSTTNGTFDGSMAHVHFIDGTAYDADTFGETDSTTGIWKPKTNPSVTYGTNGFFLKFENSSSMGTDSSGNSNDYTVNGTMTQTIDTPSNVFATFNSIHASGTATHDPNYSQGNTSVTFDNGDDSALSTLGVSSGKYYAEFKVTSDSADPTVGVGNESSKLVTNPGNCNIGNTTGEYGYFSSGNKRINGGSSTAYGDTFTTNDIIGVALDLDNGAIWFSKNGTWQNSATITEIENGTTTNAAATGLSGTFFFGCCNSASATTGDAFSVNFGNGYFGTTAVSSAQNPDDGIGIFEYDVPAGYRALCTKSINAEEYD